MQSAETTEQDKASALDAFVAALREMQKPSKAVIGQAIRDLFQTEKKKTAEAKAVAEQHQAELSDAFHAFLTLHEDTPAFAKLKADHGRLLRLASETEINDE